MNRAQVEKRHELDKQREEAAARAILDFNMCGLDFRINSKHPAYKKRPAANQSVNLQPLLWPEEPEQKMNASTSSGFARTLQMGPVLKNQLFRSTQPCHMYTHQREPAIVGRLFKKQDEEYGQMMNKGHLATSQPQHQLISPSNKDRHIRNSPEAKYKGKARNVGIAASGPQLDQQKKKEAKERQKLQEAIQFKRDCNLYEEVDANGNMNPKSSYVYTTD